MFQTVAVKHVMAAVVVVAACVSRAWSVPCPGPATVAIHADNGSAAAEVALVVEGEMLPDAVPCDGEGATSYATTVVCRGAGGVRCGEVPGLRPGAWVHRVRVTVPGSEQQVQRKRSVVLTASGVPNVVSWTVYPLTVVVRETTDAGLRGALDAASAFTAANPGARALVTFDPAVFPGAAAPNEISFGFPPLSPTTCRPSDLCTDGGASTYCFAGSNVVVDGLDRLGRRGGVVVRIGSCERSVFRITGAGNVLRGLVLRGSEKDERPDEVDTVVFAGSGALGNRVEQSIIQGPTKGDAVTIANQAGAPGGVGNETVISGSEVTGAEGKGVKVTAGAHLRLVDSCLHDNANGGLQVLGGTASAVRNVVQLTRGGTAPHGLLAGVLEEVGPGNVLVTDGNVVRFSGGRGVSVVNASTATLRHDVISENQVVGVRVETALPNVVAQANVRGAMLSCNYKVVQSVTPTCARTDDTCQNDADCGPGVACRVVPPKGLGAVVGACPSCTLPLLDLGRGGRDAGRNALTQNANRDVSGGGANLRNPPSLIARGLTISARGNQWESCGTGACDLTAVRKRDIDPPDQPDAADLGEPAGPRGGLAPVIARMVPARPRAGEFVRLYNGSLEGVGGAFNAIEGADCSRPGDAPIGVPENPCSPDSPATAARNAAGRGVNRVTITTASGAVDAEIHAVTPTMLLFRMPVECLAPVTVVASRGASASPPATLCDPGSCADRPAGETCDDGNVCTVGERCDAQGACVAPATVPCAGPCLTGACDPVTGCLVADTDPTCDDGNPCTTDRCVGLGACQSAPVDDGRTCPRADVCRSGPGTCQGGTCDGGPPLVCDDGDFCTDDVGCDLRAGCRFNPVTGVRRTTCLLDTARAALASLPRGGGAGIARRLRATLNRAERWVVRADRAKRPGRARAARAQARVALRGFVAGVRRNGDALGAVAERRLVRLGQRAVSTLRSAG